MRVSYQNCFFAEEIDCLQRATMGVGSQVWKCYPIGVCIMADTILCCQRREADVQGPNQRCQPRCGIDAPGEASCRSCTLCGHEHANHTIIPNFFMFLRG